jgi:glutaredoxin
MTVKKKSKKWLVGAAVTLIVLLGLTFGKGILSMMFTTGSGDGSAVLYHTLTCPHCQNVKDYIKEKGISGIVEKEISIDQSAANELYERLVKCSKDVSQGMPIPVLWVKDRCFIGEVEITGYFENPNE